MNMRYKLNSYVVTFLQIGVWYYSSSRHDHGFESMESYVLCIAWIVNCDVTTTFYYGTP